MAIFRFAAFMVLAAAGGCTEFSQPPVAERSWVETPSAVSYRVETGDSLYSIAWRHGVDFRELARINGIAAPYTIAPGQTLRLRSGSKPPAAQPRPAKPAHDVRVSGWTWPTPASPYARFSRLGKGLDYDLAPGTAIVSSAAGKVVYAGNGLGGFRHLVIVKHSDAYLSAYGLNVAPRVVEGQSLRSGGLIAETRASAGAGRLHFEIRHNGKPVDPAAVIR